MFTFSDLVQSMARHYLLRAMGLGALLGLLAAAAVVFVVYLTTPDQVVDAWLQADGRPFVDLGLGLAAVLFLFGLLAPATRR